MNALKAADGAPALVVAHGARRAGAEAEVEQALLGGQRRGGHPLEHPAVERHLDELVFVGKGVGIRRFRRAFRRRRLGIIVGGRRLEPEDIELQRHAHRFVQGRDDDAPVVVGEAAQHRRLRGIAGLDDVRAVLERVGLVLAAVAAQPHHEQARPRLTGRVPRERMIEAARHGVGSLLELAALLRLAPQPLLVVGPEALPAPAGAFGGARARPFGGVDLGIVLEGEDQHAPVFGIGVVARLLDGRIGGRRLERVVLLLRQQQQGVELAAAHHVALAAGVLVAGEEPLLLVERVRRPAVRQPADLVHVLEEEHLAERRRVRAVGRLDAARLLVGLDRFLGLLPCFRRLRAVDGTVVKRNAAHERQHRLDRFHAPDVAAEGIAEEPLPERGVARQDAENGAGAPAGKGLVVLRVACRIRMAEDGDRRKAPRARGVVPAQVRHHAAERHEPALRSRRDERGIEVEAAIAQVHAPDGHELRSYRVQELRLRLVGHRRHEHRQLDASGMGGDDAVFGDVEDEHRIGHYFSCAFSSAAVNGPTAIPRSGSISASFTASGLTPLSFLNSSAAQRNCSVSLLAAPAK